MGSLVSSLLITPPATAQWQFVRQRFNRLQGNLALKEAEKADGITKVNGIVSALNRHFRNESSTDHYFFVGSWAKNTAIRPPNDIDLFFIPPNEIFHQFESRTGNKQSQLLQHLKEILQHT